MQINKDRYLKKEKDTKVCQFYFQEYAKKICEEFKIKNTKEFKGQDMIFSKAKNDMINLKSKVGYCKDRGITNGRYLVAMYRK